MKETLLAALWMVAVLYGTHLNAWSAELGMPRMLREALPWIAFAIIVVTAHHARRSANGEGLARILGYGAVAVMLLVASISAATASPQLLVGSAVRAAELCAIVGALVVPVIASAAEAVSVRVTRDTLAERRRRVYWAWLAFVLLQIARVQSHYAGDALLMLTVMLGLATLVAERALLNALGVVIAVYSVALLGAANAAWDALTAQPEHLAKPERVAWAGHQLCEALLLRIPDVLIVQAVALLAGRVRMHPLMRYLPHYALPLVCLVIALLAGCSS